MKAKLSVLLFLFAIMAYSDETSFMLPIAFDNAQVNQLVIGCHEDATDGYDRGRDIYVPPFGMGTGTIGIIVDEKNPNKLYKDIRSRNLPQTWRIDCKPAKKPLVMHWSKAELPPGLQFKATSSNGRVTDMNAVFRLQISKADVITITVSPIAK